MKDVKTLSKKNNVDNLSFSPRGSKQQMSSEYSYDEDGDAHMTSINISLKEMKIESTKIEEVPSSKEKAECTDVKKVTFTEKKRMWRQLPMVRALSVEAIRYIIVSFTGMSSYFPLLDLSMTPMTRRYKDVFISNFLQYFMVMGGTDPCYITSLPSLRWHSDYWISAGLVVNTPCRIFPWTRINPYEKDVTLHDLDWYFNWENVPSWRNIRTGKKPSYPPHEYGNHDLGTLDCKLLAVEWGLISMEEVTKNCMNVVRPINMGRWDIADKYMKRGKGDITGGEGDITGEIIIEHLRLEHLERFASTYDVWDILSPLKTVEDTRIPLLRAGILQCQFLEKHEEQDAYVHLPIPLSKVPMNVVEDLFTVTLLRTSRYYWENGAQLLDSVMERFVPSLRNVDEKVKSASATHRRYKVKWIEGIINDIRADILPPMHSINAFVGSMNPITDGFILPEEVWMMDV